MMSRVLLVIFFIMGVGQAYSQDEVYLYPTHIKEIGKYQQPGDVKWELLEDGSVLIVLDKKDISILSDDFDVKFNLVGNPYYETGYDEDLDKNFYEATEMTGVFMKERHRIVLKIGYTNKTKETATYIMVFFTMGDTIWYFYKSLEV